MQIVTADRAVAGIASGDRVYVHGAAATTSVLLDALVARASELRDVQMIHLHTEGPGPHLAREMGGKADDEGGRRSAHQVDRLRPGGHRRPF